LIRIVQSLREALIELYKHLRPGDPPTLDNARNLLESLLFNPRRYDLAKVGRYKLNRNLWDKAKHRAGEPAEAPGDRVLTVNDLYKIVSRLIDLKYGLG
jgi:DNA-directed RNA polymerase subunit beta